MSKQIPLQNDSLSNADRSTVLHCITVMAQRSKQLKNDGLNPRNFFLGVASLLLVTWVFGVMPEHFWIVYIVGASILFPLRWRHVVRAKPLPKVLSWLDFCWVANILCNIGLYLIVLHGCIRQSGSFLHALGADSVRKVAFCTCWGVATRPLACAAVALRNALVFHDVDNMASVFIHILPSLLMFTLRWHAVKVASTWPTFFHLDYFDSIEPWSDIYLKSVVAYWIWFVPFTLWMATCGLKMPSKGLDTVFHSLMRKGSTPVATILGWSKEEQDQRAKKNDFTIPSVLIYMLMHAAAVCASMLVAVACWVSMYIHAFACLAVALSVIYHGSSRYSYYALDNSIAAMRKEFSGVLETETEP